MPKSDVEDLTRALDAVVRARVGGARGISGLRRLSGGASQETWAFDIDAPDAAVPSILRRRPGGASGQGMSSISLETEAELLVLAGAREVPVPGLRFVLEPADGAGSGYVMERLRGETLAPRILRDEALAAVRPRLARQCGEILARIHALPLGELPELPVSAPRDLLAQHREWIDRLDHPRPVFELALRWLEERLPEADACALVHGDFRNGNLMIDSDGVRAVLDWELAHLGDRMEDLGWICVNSWRFGRIDSPVGGFGSREELAAGYEAAGGGSVDLERVRFWEVYGSLKWGVICTMMLWAYRTGGDASVERAAIGRRVSESEIDLLELIAPPGGSGS